MIGMKLLEPIKSSTGRLVLPACEIPFREVAERAEVRRLQFDAHSRLLLWTESVEQIVLYLASANSCAADVLVAHRSIAESEIRSLMDRMEITHLVRDDLLEQHRQPSVAHLGSASICVMTSGTTSAPKIAKHTLGSLLGTIRRTSKSGAARWMLTYPPTSFAGLQVVFSAALGGGDLVIPQPKTFASFAETAQKQSVTHVSGTPTFWRGLLLGLRAGQSLPLQQITIGGEAVDQQTLDRLHIRFPEARISHIYASTEAGVGFSVQDGMAGIPAAWVTAGVNGAELRVVDGILQIRSPRAFREYQSGERTPIDAEGWLDTGDLVREESGRLVFVGRTDRRYNVGGFKVSPEEIESALMQCSDVLDVHVSCMPSPISGQVLCASVVPVMGRDPAQVKQSVERLAYQRLERHKIPRIVRVVDSIKTADSGKKQR